MLDIRAFEKDPEGTKAALLRRGEVAGLDEVLALAQSRRELIGKTQALQAERNTLNQGMKTATPEERDAKRGEMKALAQTVKENEVATKAVDEQLEHALLLLPNIPAAEIKDGASEEDNLEVKRVGEVPTFDFEPQDHQTVGEALGMIDTERAGQVSGARFAYLKGDLARLNRALTTFMLEFHLERGDTEMWTPYLVSAESMTRTGQLPKFADDAFRIDRGESDPLYLIPTAEVPLTNYFADAILDESKLPMRVVAHTPCFRAEAGSAGRDTRGLIRQHQFDKVEMVRLCQPEDAAAELDAMVQRASDILSLLGLPHRIVELCTGDLGFHSEKTYDLEVWLASQGKYREISSCSTFGTYQARRAKIRFRPEPVGNKKSKPQMLTTLNGSGLAVGRTLVAILENNQRADGTVAIPKALHLLMGGKTELTPLDS